MAGGLFGRPFAFNLKCIVFSIICMILFLYKPEFSNNYSRYITLFLIFVVAYVAIKMGMQKFNEVSPVMYGLAAFLIMYYMGPGDGNTFQWILGQF